MLTDPVALAAFLLALVAFARWLETRLALIERIGSGVVCTLLGLALANASVLPHASPAYEAIQSFAIPYALVLVLLAVNLRGLGTAGRPLLVGFLLATVGSFVGALVAGLLFARWLGPETWKLAGQFTGTFIGGSVNFVAIGRALDTDPSLFAAATVADNLSTAPWMLAQVALLPLLARHFRAAPVGVAAPGAAEGLGARLSDEWSRAEISITGLAVLGALPLAIVWTSARLAQLLPGSPTVLWQTTLALAVAQIPAIRRVTGSAVLAYFALHLFFLVIGASAVVGELVRSGGVLLVFMLVVLAFHAVVVYGGGRLVGLDLESLTIASQAAVGGPGTALALSVSMKWPSLVAPGVLLGILGYAAGNYLGFACAWLTRALLG